MYRAGYAGAIHFYKKMLYDYLHAGNYCSSFRTDRNLFFELLPHNALPGIRQVVITATH